MSASEVSAARITTVIPTYHRPEMLKRAVLSVLDQDYPRFRVRILDNGSDEESACIGREFVRSDSRVEYHRHPQNVGSLNNIIFGIESIDTEFFSVLSDDDMLMPGFFTKAVELHDRATEKLSFVASRVVTVTPEGEFSDQWPHSEKMQVLSAGNSVLKCISEGVSLPGAVYRSDVIKRVGVPRQAWWNWTESGWSALASVEAPIGLIPDVGAIVFVHPSSGSKRMAAAEFRVTWFRMMAEVRAAAEPVLGRRWWDQHMLPLVRRRFLATSARLAGAGNRGELHELAETGPAAGLAPPLVKAVLAAANVASVTGLGAIANRIGEQIRQPEADGVASGTAAARTRLARAADVYAGLNERAGLAAGAVG